MNKQSLLRAAIIVALAAVASVLCWLCFRESNDDHIADINSPTQIAGEPDGATIPVSIASPEPEEPTIQAETNTPMNEHAVTNRLGTLTIRNKDISVADNVDEATLKTSPGWMPDSALPGESGMCVILGHRNRKHLRSLENVEICDEITFTYPDGRVAVYTVTDTIIYENTADWRMPSTAGDSLVLVTCWPFRYSGNAPGKFICCAEMK